MKAIEISKIGSRLLGDDSAFELMEGCSELKKKCCKKYKKKGKHCKKCPRG